jgi:hypothetical protein
MLKRGPFSFISYELVKESKGIVFSAKIASFFTGFEGRKGVVFTLLLRALRAVKKNLNSSPCSLSRLYLERFLK